MKRSRCQQIKGSAAEDFFRGAPYRMGSGRSGILSGFGRKIEPSQRARALPPSRSDETGGIRTASAWKTSARAKEMRAETTPQIKARILRIDRSVKRGSPPQVRRSKAGWPRGFGRLPSFFGILRVRRWERVAISCRPGVENAAPKLRLSKRRASDIMASTNRGREEQCGARSLTWMGC